jgi:hypothetical protein
MFRAVAIRFGRGKLFRGGTGEIALSIRVRRGRGRGAAGDRLLVEFVIGFIRLKRQLG